MRLFAPARLQALVLVGGLVTLVMMTRDACTWLDFTDEDSVAQLTEARACELARRHSGMLEGTKCSITRSTTEMTEVRLGDIRTVCFLKAARWFVVDGDAASDCPPGPPVARERVHTLREEQKLEAKWVELLVRQRDVAAHTLFLERLSAAVKAWESAKDVPRVCPELEKGRVDAVDVDVTRPRVSAPWHYLTSDRLERLLTDSGSWGAGAQVRELKRKTPRLLFIAGREKVQPFENAPGTFRGKVALVEWWTGNVLCEADLEFEQQTDAPQDRYSVAAYLPDFKESLLNALTATTLSMSNGQLQLTDTF